MTCPFCNLDSVHVFHTRDDYYCAWDAFPVSEGHALVVPRRHFSSWFEATDEERRNLMQGITIARDAIQSQRKPDGFNIGINVGESAGQTVPHLHIHVIPRYRGDVRDPRGGIRHVIPGKGNYVRDSKDDRETTEQYSEARPPKIFGSGLSSLMEGLARDLTEASAVDLAVAFITASGLHRLEPYLVDMLDAGGRLRILTGDYLDVTEPRALLRILDLVQEYSEQEQVNARVFQADSELGFHPKAYLLRKDYAGATAYIGSSNLTKHALESGIEWNQRVEAGMADPPILEITEEFERLFVHPKTVALNPEWIAAYTNRRKASSSTLKAVGMDSEAEAPDEVPTPHPIQDEALTALESTRDSGNQAGLVVMATGLGKTWLAAFDSAKFERILFVAHREEILNQALNTIRKIRPDANLGLYTGGRHESAADVLFASIQTLGKANHLRQFDQSRFDYVVIDEFHHAAATTYRRLIDYFQPDFLLGLTATPERTDGGDLLALCGENLVFRCDLADGINRDLLCPFAYFGVPDEVDFSNIPWRSGRFDPTALEHAVATEKRAQNAFEQWTKRSQSRTLAFCVSKQHADFMSAYFRERGCKSVAVHSGPTSAPRSSSLDALGKGELDIIFAVDMFNEGIDVPEIDTVMMLRPTESKILWLQQFGRGLRKAADKAKLTVIDYIGNHRTFLQVPALLFPDIGGHPGEISRALAALQRGDLSLPAGCSISYELEAIEILKKLAAPTAVGDQIQQWYRTFKDFHGRRATASEAYHEGYEPKLLRRQFGSWINFVRSEGDLTKAEESAFSAHKDFIEALESTPMTKSFKMVVLLGMIASERFPGDIGIDELVDQATRIGRRIRQLRDEFGDALTGEGMMRSLLESNPIAAWVGGKGTGDKQYFSYEDGVFRSFEAGESEPTAIRDLVRELADYRLAKYLDRLSGEDGAARKIVCKVSHSSGQPIIFLPDRNKYAGIPEGWTRVYAAGKPFTANFVKIAVNVMRETGGERNVLPTVLRSFFGENAGRPGTIHQVKFELRDDGYELSAVGPGSAGPELWREYMRAEIPPLWGLEFSPSKWNQGFVRAERHLFLLVSLDKSGMAENHQYEDQFLSSDTFRWVSQNRTKRDSPTGRQMSHHQENDTRVHLFVRDRRKTPAGKAAPFTYCGEIEFVEWEHDKPIFITWKLGDPIPNGLKSRFGIAP